MVENVELFTEGGLKVNITLRGTLVKMRQPYEQHSRLIRQNLKLDQGVSIERGRFGWKPVCLCIASWDYAEPNSFDRDDVVLMSWWW